MTTESVEKHWITRINNQMNYERKFYSPEKVVVTIPTLHFQAFDIYLSRTQIKPWNIVDLIVSARLFTQYPVKHAGNPCDSIVDTHLLMKENILFFVAMKVDINRIFHDPETPKFPLSIEAEVTHAGNSSTRRSYTVKHPSISTPYITCQCDDVLVSKSNRQPAMFPDWWKKKYSKLVKPKEIFKKPSIHDGAYTKDYNMKVEFEHLDHNSHTTTSAYLKFSINAAFQTVRDNPSGYISIEHMRAGLKSITMFFHGESNFGDMLNVKTSENCCHGNVMLVEIRNLSRDKTGNDGLCCSVVLEFYEPMESENCSKL